MHKSCKELLIIALLFLVSKRPYHFKCAFFRRLRERSAHILILHILHQAPPITVHTENQLPKFPGSGINILIVYVQPVSDIHF